MVNIGVKNVKEISMLFQQFAFKSIKNTLYAQKANISWLGLQLCSNEGDVRHV